MVAPGQPYSLRARLLFWLLVPLAIGGSLSLQDTARQAHSIADSVFDRVLAGSALAIGERIGIAENGEIEVDVPYVALDMLTSAAQDRIFYRIEGPPGEFISGYSGLPQPTDREDATGVRFFDGVYRGDEIRLCVIEGAASSGLSSVAYRVTVAETTNARRRLASDILLRAAIREVLLIVGAVAIVWLAVTQGLKPLHSLEEAIRRRTPDDLRPIAHRGPREVSGLVTTVNGFMDRLRSAIDGLRHFTGNAGHQLRTPLTVARTQLAIAARAESVSSARAALAAGDEALVHAERLLAQLLVLARIDEAASHRLATAKLDLSAVAAQITGLYVRKAAEAGIDLGFESEGATWIVGDEMLAGEMVRNLVENAVNYAGRDSVATVRVSAHGPTVELTVEDNGPGMPSELRVHAGERFATPPHANGKGAGLGLSIVAEIAALSNGTLDLDETDGGRGVRARIAFPIATT